MQSTARATQLIQKAHVVLEDELKSAALQADFKQIKKILSSPDKKLTINTQHPATGRTLMHHVASQNNKEFYQRLMNEYNPDQTIRDKEGFTAAELLMYPHSEYKIENTKLHEKDLNYYATYCLSELNLKIEDLYNPSRDRTYLVPKKLVLVPSTSEMLKYAEQHPELQQIGFIIKRPNENKGKMPSHLSCIMFDRVNELFIQLDSFGFMYVLPDSAKMKFIYATFTRQRSPIGCQEDAIYIAFYILTKYSDFFKFCLSHIIKDNKIFKKFSPSEQSEFNLLNKQGYGNLSKKDREKYDVLNNRDLVQKQLFVLQSQYIKPQTNIFKLTEWPIHLLLFLERFDQVRKFRTANQLGNKKYLPILNMLLKYGERRKTYSNETLIKNVIVKKRCWLFDFSQNYDIAGTNFALRRRLWMWYRERRHARITHLFNKKLLHANSTLKPQDQSKIVDKILDFAGLNLR